MSLVAICLNLLLAGLLVAALVMGVRLERRLKGVRDGQVAFTKAVADLDQSAVKARQGLADLRAATDEATDTLGGRIVRARDAADRLDALVKRAESVTARPQYQDEAPAAPAGPEGGLAALLKQLKESEGLISPPSSANVRAALSRQAAPTGERPLRLHRADDDLFEDAGDRS